MGENIIMQSGTVDLCNNESPKFGQKFEDRKVHLILVRHGVSEHNQACQILINGKASYNYRFNSNPEHINYKPSYLLNEGKIQITETAKNLCNKGVDQFNAIAYVSPLPRTQQSAEILCQHGVIGTEYITDKRIIEAQAGELEGQFGLYPNNYQKVSREAKEVNKYESKESLGERVKDFMLSMQNEVSKLNFKNIVIVSHDSVLESIVQIFRPDYAVVVSPGHYLEYDLCFNSITPNVIGTLI